MSLNGLMDIGRLAAVTRGSVATRALADMQTSLYLQLVVSALVVSRHLHGLCDSRNLLERFNMNSDSANNLS